MRLTVVGSGAAFGCAGLNASYCLDGRVLVDCGAPLHHELPRSGIDVHAPFLLLVTHFHFDHIGQIPLLLGARALTRPDPQPLTIGGPPGTLTYLLRVLQTGYGNHLAGLIRERMQLDDVVLQDGSDVRIGDYRVRAASVVHSTGPSLSYAVSGPDGVTIGFSGDTTMCAGLERVTAMCDLMVVECTGWDGPVHSHLWADEVAGLAGRHPRTRMVLSHVVERRDLPGALVAHDRLSLDVPPRDAPLPAPPAALVAG
ncbi:MAG TPA: MBL fold metallo-hydrolase [Candidatus Dormibacteraeota bacterium]|nr:MBL fold metallo-hydrolase [Candidatus Dormibacteraeota bacterium]